ncbi:hypothetical protein [Roseobacter sp.]|uniref:hypothetical protein n=1 Tax=Roseobacter sp. TaxID=1907202 RepID=UPI00385BB2F7
MKKRVDLDYNIGSGWLAPWLEGLRSGQAVASTCPTCEDAFFPPMRSCPICRLPTTGWRTLNGHATILFRTNGTDGDAAMVQFDGASGAAIAKTEGLPADATRVLIVASICDPPVLSLATEPTP